MVATGKKLLSVTMTSRSWRWVLTLLPLLAGCIVGIVGGWVSLGVEDGYGYPWAALAWTCGVLFVILASLEVVFSQAKPLPPGVAASAATDVQVRARYGWYRAVIGADGRVSTSKTQAFAWTLILAGLITYMTAIGLYARGRAGFEFSDGSFGEYLLLLGIPLGTAAAAKGIVVAKNDAGMVQNTVTSAASADARGVPVTGGGGEGGVDRDHPAVAADVVSNDDGEIDMNDTQYFVFNLVAMFYVVGTFAGSVIGASLHDPKGLSLPEIPWELLALTGPSAASYALGKGLQRSGPKVTSVLPSPATVGAGLVIGGVNLAPVSLGPSAAAAGTSVLLSATTAVTAAAVVAAHEPLPEGDPRREGDPVADDEPAVGGEPLAVGAGGGGDDPVEHSQPGWVIGALDASPAKVTFKLPAGVPAGNYSVTVRTAGNVTTDPYPLEVKAAT
jgi:hypothetical protein